MRLSLVIPRVGNAKFPLGGGAGLSASVQDNGV